MFRKILFTVHLPLAHGKPVQHIYISCKEEAHKKNCARFQMLVVDGLYVPKAMVLALNAIKQCLVSICIPSTWIHQLSFNGQLGLQGIFVDVMENVSKTQSILRCSDKHKASMVASTKRKLSCDHAYMSGAMYPLCTIAALIDFLNTSLYIANHVVLNEEW